MTFRQVREVRRRKRRGGRIRIEHIDGASGEGDLARMLAQVPRPDGEQDARLACIFLEPNEHRRRTRIARLLWRMWSPTWAFDEATRAGRSSWPRAVMERAASSCLRSS